MRAYIYHRYGPPDVLRLEERSKPVPIAGEVLIRVRAASVNPYDWHCLRGDPFLVRLVAGLAKPNDPRLGADLCGEVEAVGPGVTQFKPGDAVFGMGKGAYADYACAPAFQLGLKPAGTSFEQSAAVPIAGLTALQALRKAGLAQDAASGRSLLSNVLINGGSGGVGTFAVQIAKAFGAHVTAVCSTRNVEMVRGLGADRVIDYAKEDFTRTADGYDVIVDNVANRGLLACRHILKPNGSYVVTGTSARRWVILRVMVQGLAQVVLSLSGSRKFHSMLAKANTADLSILADLMAAGKLTPVIDRRYPFAELPEAIRYVETGHARAKVVVTL